MKQNQEIELSFEKSIFSRGNYFDCEIDSENKIIEAQIEKALGDNKTLVIKNEVELEEN